MNAKEQELLTILDNIEKAYSPDSNQYKFSYVFYNVVNMPFARPANFPVALWNQALLPDPNLMPVILNRPQIEERIKQQNELAAKINGARASIFKGIESLKERRALVLSKLENIYERYRRVRRNYICGEPADEVYRLNLDVATREPFTVYNKREEVMECLSSFRERFTNLEKKIEKSIQEIESKRISKYKLDVKNSQ
ncbi:hypothetical protein ENBRE01_0879 [Enteropsectra breve]|nr:hypothetical protein ENBRE01_0879 [Enteropsectra breve]